VVVLYKTIQQIGKATIAVGVKEEEGTQDICRCCRGGGSERRYRFGGLSVSRSFKCKRLCFASGVEEEVATIEKRV
jgi:hypothetical protein